MKNKKQSPSSLLCSVAMSIVLCFLLLSAASCHKKPIIRTVKVISECYDNNNSRSSWDWLEQESLPPLLRSVTQSQNGTVYNKDLYEYNNQQLVRIHRDLTYSSPIEVVFGYDNSGRVVTQTLNDNDGVLGKATFTYDDHDQIVRAEYLFDDDFAKHQHYVAPWHQAAHRAIVKRLKSMKKDAKETYSVLVDYVYEGGNLVSESWNYDGESQVIHYTYDNAFNPFQGLWMLDEELVLYPDQLSTNNVLTTIYYADGDTDTDNNTYMYDDENYPIAIIQSFAVNDTIRWNYKKLQYTAVDPK